VSAVAEAGYPRLNYDSWARTVPAEDLWAQVRRTVRGHPVPETDIALMVATIAQRLCLGPGDVLLDLACGNGALASRLFPLLGGYVGSDISPYLIGIAQARFAAPGREFLVSGAAEHVEGEPDPDRFTKALCYGSFAYLGDEEATAMLGGLFARFPKITRLFLGNLPDPERLESFYGRALPSRAELADPESRIGVWRSRAALSAMATAAGWKVTFSGMPHPFFASHYRFDALLLRP